MEINLGQARKTLRDIDQQLKDTIKKVPPAGTQGADSVDLSSLQNKGPIKSQSASQLYGELSENLQSLMSMVGDQAGRQKELEGMFGDKGQGQDIQKRAQELLDGYFNVENTAGRIFDFAFSFYDGSQDRETFARDMQSNIHEGFRQAEKMLGGLADISKDTRNRLDEMVDNFIKDGKEDSGSGTDLGEV